MPFEPQMPGFLTGTINATVIDPAGLVPQTNIIQIPDQWRVRVQWSISGLFVPMLAPGATWKVSVYLESIGPGLESQVASLNVPLGAPMGLTHTYDHTLIVPGNYPGLTAGAYKLVTVLTIDNGGAPWPMAGFVDGPVLQFYQYP
jgi:hypothetical protein